MLLQLLIAEGTFSMIWGVTGVNGDEMETLEFVDIIGQVMQPLETSSAFPEQADLIFAVTASESLEPGDAQ
jgi:hypothetical protein